MILSLILIFRILVMALQHVSLPLGQRINTHVGLFFFLFKPFLSRYFEIAKTSELFFFQINRNVFFGGRGGGGWVFLSENELVSLTSSLGWQST